MNRLFELETHLKGLKRKKSKPSLKAGVKKPATNGKARSVSKALSRPVDYTVPGIVGPEAQPSSMTCWATVTTMMIGWRDQMSYPIETALAEVGPSYVAKFRANQGLSAAEKGPFLAAAGLEAEPPMSFTLEAWEQMLRDYGPLWVTTDENVGPGFSIHARIIRGMHGDGTAGGTEFDVVDPAGGREYRERVSAFLHKFEEVVGAAGSGPLFVQVVHWPRGTGPGRTSVSKSLSRFSRAKAGPAAAVEIAGLGFEVLKGVLENEGDVSWELQQMNGIKSPRDDQSYGQREPWGTKTDTMYAYVTNMLGDKIEARFEVRFQYNGHALGNIQITNTGTNDAALWGLRVSAQIMPDQQAYRVNGKEPVAAIEVTFHYRFSRTIGSDKIYVGRYKLYGTGDFDYSGRWTQ